MTISSISANVMGMSSVSAASQMVYNEPFCRDCFDNAGKARHLDFPQTETIQDDFPLKTKRSVPALQC
jgi:hypothetical protein